MNAKNFFLLLTVFLACTLNTYGSDQITVSGSGIQLRRLFSMIEEQSDYLFFFVDSDIDGVEISVDVKDASVESVLNRALAQTNLVYEIEGRYITILAKKPGGGSVSQQGVQPPAVTVSGQCTDQNGLPLPGVVVMLKGKDTGTVVGDDGSYSIEVPDSQAVLVFSCLGYDEQEIPVRARTRIDVVMTENAMRLDDVVVVGYGTQVKGKLTGSVSDLKSDKLAKAPIANVTHALAGQLPGMIVVDQGGQPGSNMASLSIRGFGSALVIVDGVESSFTNLDPSQIESVSILKDGAASIYGARAGNGVILVTTKRGNMSKPTITVNSSVTMQTVTRMLQPASSGQWAELDREIWHLGGETGVAPWTEEDIAKFYAGNDPSHPNSDWFDFVLRKVAPMQNHNISVRGGSERIRYYGFFGYTDQETIIRHNGGNYQRYNIQSNIDADITRHLKLSIDLSINYENHYFAKRGVGNGGYFWNDLYGSKPWYPTEFPDKTKIAYSGIDVGSPYAMSNIEIAGYDKTQNRNIRGGISLEYDFSRWIKGLKAKAYVNYRDDESYYKGFSRPTSTYTYNYDTGEYSKFGDYKTQADLSESVSRSNVLTQQYSVSYDNTFKDHHLSVIALYEAITYNSNWISAYRDKFMTPTIEQLNAGSSEGKDNGGGASEMGRMSVVGRLNYSYKDKYLLEAILRADASAYFAPGYRWGYFPGVSAGWVISKEGFMSDAAGWMELLKLRASYGASGNDSVASFAYLAGYAIESSNTYILGDSPQKLLYATGLANPELSWEKMNIYNVGVDFSFLKSKLHGSLEFFYRTRTGIPASRITSLPSTFGANLPVENLNSTSDRGFELELGTEQQFGQVAMSISGNISWSRAKWSYYEEPEYTDPDQYRLSRVTGTWLDNTIGYRSDGLFTSQEEIDNYPVDYSPVLAGGNAALRPGDIKFIDTNGDGKLDWRDQEFLGAATTPHWMYGLNIGLRYRNFDLSALFQGAFGYMTSVSSIAYSAFRTEQQYNLRWSEKNNVADALLPRLSGASTNAMTSDFFYKKSAYIRLKNLTIGYELPHKLLSKAGISQLRIYLAGTNLFTGSNLNKYGIDPEAPWLFSYYPQQRTYSIGVNLSF